MARWPSMTPVPVDVRFWKKVDKSGDCWLWTGYRRSNGYGMFGKQGAHRFAYELMIGSIPEGLQVDHMCHNRACVNPHHLRIATAKQNVENARGPLSTGTSGYRGVSRVTGYSDRWRAAVCHNGKSNYLGTFRSPEAANAAAIAARNELFTHNDADRIPTRKASAK